jgi:glucose-1-phosphate cytidylyltransferase
MRYYAHYGHNEFILCLGYRADLIKEFFLGYNEALYADVTVSRNGKEVEFLEPDVQDWKVTLVDTGEASNIGERLLAVADHLRGEEMFLANYSDGLSDLDLGRFVDDFRATDAACTFLSVRPSQSFHVIAADDEGAVKDLLPVQDADLWINGGFFVMRAEIFDHMRAGEELVEEPFKRLIELGKLRTCRYEGFWASVDTFKDKVKFDTMVAKGDTPWMLWK